MSDLWDDLRAESQKPGPTMTITKAQYGALLNLNIRVMALEDLVRGLRTHHHDVDSRGRLDRHHHLTYGPR